MKIAIIGAGGVRTPLLVRALAACSERSEQSERLGLDELALMDIDAERLELIGALCEPGEGRPLPFRMHRTTDPAAALAGANFVITTFRVGNVPARVIDERVPLRYGVLGQETTGPGGFAMAMRSIPVLLDYVEIMRSACPDAWLINFANPAGMLAEAAIRVARWPRVAGICDAPAGIQRAAAALLGAAPDDIFLDYFGLNHLGWVRAAVYRGRDVLPEFIAGLVAAPEARIPGLPFDANLIARLGMVPNEYLYYYYYAQDAVRHILEARQTRGEEIVRLSEGLYADLRRLRAEGDLPGMVAAHERYLSRRGETYMAAETGEPKENREMGESDDPAARRISPDFPHSSDFPAAATGGYAGVALDLIEALSGSRPRQMILNVANRGAIAGMAEDDVIEAPAYVDRDLVRPLAVGRVPRACLGLMQQVKAYERLTIEAATENSYTKALQALTLHPLVRDYGLAARIVDDYRREHGALFPELR